MRMIKDKFYHPNNSIIVVAGNVDHKIVLQKVKAIYGDWEPSDFDPFEKYPIPEIKPLEKSTYFITENENATTPIILMCLHGPDTRNDIPSTYAADIFSAIVSQKVSKLQQDLVESGLAYNVGVSYSTNKYVGPIQIVLVPNPSIDYYTNYVENMNKVTRDDIKKYVNTYIIGKPRVVGLLLSPAMKAQLQIESLESYLNK